MQRIWYGEHAHGDCEADHGGDKKHELAETKDNHVPSRQLGLGDELAALQGRTDSYLLVKCWVHEWDTLERQHRPGARQECREQYDGLGQWSWVLEVVEAWSLLVTYWVGGERRRAG